jgi:serine/threonine protein kinase
MAEPQSGPDGPPEAKTPPPITFAVPPPTGSDSARAADLFGNGALEPTDDTPTVISRTALAPVRPEEALAAVLRGRYLAHFELLEPIGVGGMAAVIRARDTQLDRTVALKILPPEMAGDPENVRRFHQEARAAAKLDHENIARVFFCGEDQGLHFIAFEFVEGENLGALLEQRGRLRVPEAIGYVLQIATGLAHAAARGVVHRDIKPSNIIISGSGRAKLVDMGLARSLEPQADGGLTQPGVTLGTFDYISPEQALEPREADVRSDIYSLGCTLYHMVTGQPPVPDGTAAKKLHHHQHVDPVDPRQLNREVPDDVAALLARMMAKDPKQRYARPELLVRHLIGLAQKLGVATDVPDSFLFVDAPLPGPPRTRPLLVSALATMGVLVLVFVLPWSPITQRPSSLRDPLAGAEPRPRLPSEPLVPEQDKQTARRIEGTVPDLQNPKVTAYQFHDAKGLIEQLRKHPETETVYLNEDLTLTPDEMLVLQDHNLTIEPKDPHPEQRPTIRLNRGRSVGNEFSSALTVKSGKVTIRNVRFEVDARASTDAPTAALTHQGGRLTLENCEFVQLLPPEAGQAKVSSVLVSGPSTKEEMAELVLENCYFVDGQHAVSLSRPATVRASDCAFGPHLATLFRLEEKGRLATLLETTLNLQNCSAILTGGAVFRLEGAASRYLEVKECVFSRPEGNAGSQGAASLIVHSGDPAGDFHYSGRHNCYHNLASFWVELSAQEPEKAITSLSGFGQGAGVLEDKSSVEAAESPWESPEPLRALEDEEPRQAFRLRRIRQYRHRTHLIGVDQCVWGRTYTTEELLALEEKKSPEPLPANEEKVVLLGTDSYRTLRQALEDAKPGETIVSIKKDGLFRVDPIQLDKAGVNVTIKAHPGYHPILTIGETRDKNAALFHLHDGQLTLEQLEFRLLPGRSEFTAQAVVAVMGNGQCTLRDCVITLETKEIPLTLVTLPDASGVMQMGPSLQQQSPKVSIENCFVRGAGDLLSLRTSRPFELKVEDSLVALDGSLVIVDGNSKEASTRMGHSEITLKQVTTYLTEHLIWLRASKEESRSGKGLVRTHVSSVTNSLFVSGTGGRALVHLDGVDTDDQMRRFLTWGDSQHNAYSGFERLLDQQPQQPDSMAPPAYGTTQWKDFTQEQGGRFDRVRFSSPLAPETFAKATPADFKPKAEANWQGYGVDVERLLERLPKPFEENAPGERSSDD